MYILHERLESSKEANLGRTLVNPAVQCSCHPVLAALPRDQLRFRDDQVGMAGMGQYAAQHETPLLSRGRVLSLSFALVLITVINNSLTLVLQQHPTIRACSAEVGEKACRGPQSCLDTAL